jgi:uncharacterized protein (TIGR02594 family)
VATVAAATVAVVTAKGLRLRAQPSLSSLILRTVARGSKVRVLDHTLDGLWSRVEQPISGGVLQGWMATKYLADESHPAALGGLREEPWMSAALHELGVKETPGAEHSARVLAYLASTDLDAALADSDETPWCSAFVNWCLEVSGLSGTNSAAARSWMSWGQSLVVPKRGAITVLSRDAGGPTSGHVGFFLSHTETRVRLLGGNQGNQVCVAEYERRRVLGHRVPT